MLIYSKYNFILPSEDRSQTVLVKRNCIGEIPTWAAETDYFKALVKDGSIVVTTPKQADKVAEAEVAKEVKKVEKKTETKKTTKKTTKKKAETKASAQPPAKAEAQAAD